MGQMTVARGLVELKLLDARIERAILEGTYVTASLGGQSVNNLPPLDGFEAKAKASLASAQDLTKRRDAIKSAIVVSNALKKVKVGDRDMTVAEAIERKHSIAYTEKLRDHLRQLLQNTIGAVDRKNVENQQRLDKMLEANYGKDAKTNASDYESITGPFWERNKAEVVDPLKLRDVIEKLTQEIESFKANVDISLNESNVNTRITVPD